MIYRVTALALFLLNASVAFAEEPKLYKLRFREGAENCAVVRVPGSWQYSPERLSDELTPGQWELRKDAIAPAPGYLLRWNGELGFVPANYSENVFGFEWTGSKPMFFAVAPERWVTATKVAMTWAGNTHTHSSGGDDPKVAIDGRSFHRTGKHWTESDSDAILTADKRWLVLQSSDGKIVHRTIFGEGPDHVLAGRIHIDIYHVPTGKGTIRLELDQTENQGLDAFLNETYIYESRYLFLRVDPRPQHLYYLVCKLPIEP